MRGKQGATDCRKSHRQDQRGDQTLRNEASVFVPCGVTGNDLDFKAVRGIRQPRDGDAAIFGMHRSAEAVNVALRRTVNVNVRSGIAGRRGFNLPPTEPLPRNSGV
jgi:hypothetical protein